MLLTLVRFWYAYHELILYASVQYESNKYTSFADMINMIKLSFMPSHSEWIHSPGDAINALAVYVHSDSSLLCFLTLLNL